MDNHPTGSIIHHKPRKTTRPARRSDIEAKLRSDSRQVGALAQHDPLLDVVMQFPDKPHSGAGNFFLFDLHFPTSFGCVHATVEATPPATTPHWTMTGERTNWPENLAVRQHGQLPTSNLPRDVPPGANGLYWGRRRCSSTGSSRENSTPETFDAVDEDMFSGMASIPCTVSTQTGNASHDSTQGRGRYTTSAENNLTHAPKRGPHTTRDRTTRTTHTAPQHLLAARDATDEPDPGIGDTEPHDGTTPPTPRSTTMTESLADHTTMTGHVSTCKTTEQAIAAGVAQLKRLLNTATDTAKEIVAVCGTIAEHTHAMHDVGTEVGATWEGQCAKWFNDVLPTWGNVAANHTTLADLATEHVEGTKTICDSTRSTLRELSTILAQTSQIISTMQRQTQSQAPGA